MRILVGIGISILLAVSAFGIMWAASNDFGQRQGVEFYPYTDNIDMGDGSSMISSGVTILVNVFESAPTDQAMATLMLSAKKLYPEECSGENFEVAVRRTNPDGAREKYSFSYSIYDTQGPISRIEYGKWKGERYEVRESYAAEWQEIAEIASGQRHFQINAETDN